jgi:ketosteroid isomerase-like protein
MPTTSHEPEALAALSPPVAAYVKATNSFDLERLLELFADDALVNDQLRDYWGKPAIREWAERDIVGQNLTMEVTTVIEHYGNCIVTANVRGKFDMAGLPDPLVYAFYFSPHGDRIVQLIILRNRYDV